MVALQIRGVSDEVRETLAERASARGQSLQAFLLSLIEDEARRSKNLVMLGRFANRDDGSQLAVDEASHALDEVRAAREAEVTERHGSSSGSTA